MSTAITVVFLVVSLLCLLAAFGFVGVVSVGADALFVAGVFLGWAGLTRLP